MLLISLILIGLLGAAAIAYVVAPLWQPARPLRSQEDDELADLIYRKDETMRSIKEVEFDYHTGKLSQEDYELYDQRLRQQAIGLIRQIEKRSPDMVELDSALEHAIAAKRTVKTPMATNGDAPVIAPSVPSPEPDTLFCHNCGAKAQSTDRFCAKCGTPLRVPTA